LKQVFSRTETSARSLSGNFGAGMTTRINEIQADADFYLVSVSDQALPQVLGEMHVSDRLVIHTAGMHGLEVFQGLFRNCGILYPLQTFTKNIYLNLGFVPILIEGSNAVSTKEISEIAGELSERVMETDSEERNWYHLAAVISANFSNYMYSLAEELLQKQGLDFTLLIPLLQETLRKAGLGQPWKCQTGPAIRGDKNTMDKHLYLLSSSPGLPELYKFISGKIRDFHNSIKSKEDANGEF
jgi:predicted short-subunit dehydrogenase-like oxidoreductase (DUF2520 family)